MNIQPHYNQGLGTAAMPASAGPEGLSFDMPEKGTGAADQKITLDTTHPLFGTEGDRSFDLGDPAARFLGSTLPGGNAVFALFPTGGSDDESDDVRMPTLFYSRTLDSVSNGIGALTGGIIATANPDGTVQLGGGGAARIGPVLAFLNMRSVGNLDPEGAQTLIPNANGDFFATLNFGLGFSLNDAVSGLSRAGSMIAGLAGGPFAPAAAGGLQTVAATSDAMKGFANTFAGLGYGIEVRGNVNDPGNLSFYQNGREIDLESTIERYVATMSGEAAEPTFFPEGPDAPDEVRTVNDIIALAYDDKTPFELAGDRGDTSNIPSVQLANEMNRLTFVMGQAYYPFLSPESQAIVAHGPSSVEEFTRVINDLWHSGILSPSARNEIVQSLANPYDINFGIPDISVANEAFLTEPADYAATREALGVSEPAF